MDINSRLTALPPAAGNVIGDAGKLQVPPELATAVRAINASKLFGLDNELRFAMDRESKRSVLRLVDKKTGMVIWELSQGSAMRMVRSLDLH